MLSHAGIALQFSIKVGVDAQFKIAKTIKWSLIGCRELSFLGIVQIFEKSIENKELSQAVTSMTSNLARCLTVVTTCLYGPDRAGLLGGQKWPPPSMGFYHSVPPSSSHKLTSW